MAALRLASWALLSTGSLSQQGTSCDSDTCDVDSADALAAGEVPDIKLSMLQKAPLQEYKATAPTVDSDEEEGAADSPRATSRLEGRGDLLAVSDVESRPASGAGGPRVFYARPHSAGAEAYYQDVEFALSGDPNESQTDGYSMPSEEYFELVAEEEEDEGDMAWTDSFPLDGDARSHGNSSAGSHASGGDETFSAAAAAGQRKAGTDSCSHFGCKPYKHGQACQCNSACKKYKSCCSDYAAICGKANDGATTTTTTTTIAPPVLKYTTGPLAGVYGHPNASIDYPKYEGFTLVLAEEFDEPIDLDRDPIWTWSDGGLRESAVRFVKEQVLFEDGKMIVEVSNKRPYPEMQSCSMASKEYVPRKPLISGELRSRYNAFRYGRYEVRMKAPEVQPGKPHVNGNYIATMFVYRDANAHHWREIDFELTGDRTNSLTLNLLVADGTKNWRPFLQDTRKPWLADVNLRKDYYTYAFEWTSKIVIWYFDGKAVRKGTRLKNPDKSCKIMMNTWIFGPGSGFGGGQKYNNRYPMRTYYEYFRFYKWDEEKEYPCQDLSPNCLKEDDHFLATNNPCDGIPQKGLLYGRGVCKAECKK
eukprot:TRINITY_DN3237_c0_g5_i1.p1 TRINITY_DN3237_c0_g5~~TRINITY_DN3237_c0_g5_i1.p1  ORF type:complete len:606 (-),score=119.52 TRINITY_DN3237_c0_g5_i1:286-2055(-)